MRPRDHRSRVGSRLRCREHDRTCDGGHIVSARRRIQDAPDARVRRNQTREWLRARERYGLAERRGSEVAKGIGRWWSRARRQEADARDENGANRTRAESAERFEQRPSRSRAPAVEPRAKQMRDADAAENRNRRRVGDSRVELSHKRRERAAAGEPRERSAPAHAARERACRGLRGRAPGEDSSVGRSRPTCEPTRGHRARNWRPRARQAEGVGQAV
jgi:hypothetical protein